MTGIQAGELNQLASNINLVIWQKIICSNVYYAKDLKIYFKSCQIFNLKYAAGSKHNFLLVEMR